MSEYIVLKNGITINYSKPKKPKIEPLEIHKINIPNIDEIIDKNKPKIEPLELNFLKEPYYKIFLKSYMELCESYRKKIKSNIETNKFNEMIKNNYYNYIGENIDKKFELNKKALNKITIAFENAYSDVENILKNE